MGGGGGKKLVYLSLELGGKGERKGRGGFDYFSHIGEGVGAHNISCPPEEEANGGKGKGKKEERKGDRGDSSFSCVRGGGEEGGREGPAQPRFLHHMLYLNPWKERGSKGKKEERKSCYLYVFAEKRKEGGRKMIDLFEIARNRIETSAVLKREEKGGRKKKEKKPRPPRSLSLEKRKEEGPQSRAGQSYFY